MSSGSSAPKTVSAGRIAEQMLTYTPPMPDKLRQLYPEIEPYNTGFLKVSDIHTLYYEECGNPKGNPAVVVHGGPGGGISEYYRQFFDPQAYRIILFDQRGAGKSTPAACLEENTTWHLVDDMEKLRTHLGVDRWVVFGGSWGSTLSLAYAQKHADRVKALVLRGIFLLRQPEIHFFYQDGASWIYPDAWEHFLAPIPEVERKHLLSAYTRRLTGNDEAEKERCALAWSIWELTTSRLYVDPKYIAQAEDDKLFAMQFARIETHYFTHGGFFEVEDQLLRDAHKIRHIPTWIVSGRYDLVCPVKSAWDLHKELPDAKLRFVADAGHSAKEAGIVHYLMEATEEYKNL